jgi:hypothetical protein
VGCGLEFMENGRRHLGSLSGAARDAEQQSRRIWGNGRYALLLVLADRATVANPRAAATRNLVFAIHWPEARSSLAERCLYMAEEGVRILPRLPDRYSGRRRIDGVAVPVAGWRAGSYAIHPTQGAQPAPRFHRVRIRGRDAFGGATECHKAVRERGIQSPMP